MKVSIRPFEKKDIPKKVEWINNSENNQFLHYDIPIDVAKTERWFEKNQGLDTRYDAIIEADGIACGTIGLLNIDKRNGKAEYYIAMGEVTLKRRGVSTIASQLVLDHAFITLGLNRVYLYTEVENIAAQHLFEKVGFIKEGHIRDDLFYNGKYVDRFLYGICRKDYVNIKK